MDIIKAIEDPRFFRPVFKDLETWGAWFTYLRALFGLPLDVVKEGKLFESCTGLDRVSKSRARESFVICGRRSGKSFISSVIAVYLATFKDWSKVFSPGERGFIFIIATDKSQAKIIKSYISGILNSSLSFKKLISKDLTWDVELKNSVTISVKTCSFRSVRGYTLIAAICEELAFWRSEDSANPDREILTALRPALAQFDESLLLGISTPYSKRGVLFESFSKHYAKEGGPLVWRAPTSRMNPTIKKKLIKKAFDEDPQAALSEYEAQFRTDLQQLIPLEAVEACTIPDRFELPRIRATEYYAFTDPSGGRQDSFTLGISHKGKDGTAVLDLLREVKPPFQPEQVVAEFAGVLRGYGVSTVEADRYAREWVTDSFKRNGITVKNSKLTKSAIYLELLPLINSGRCELLDNKRLKVQLNSLERRTRSGGRDSVDSFPGLHDDVSNVAAGALVIAEKKEKKRIGFRRITYGPDEPEDFWEHVF